MKYCYRLIVAIAITILGSAKCIAQQGAAIERVKEGKNLFDAGKYSEAIAKYEQAIELEPGNPYANYYLALAYYGTRKPDLALLYAKKVASPDTVLMGDVNLLLGGIYNSNKQYEKALRYLEAAEKATPDNSHVYTQLAISNHKLTNHVSAEKYIMKALKMDPYSPENHRVLGDIFYRTENWDRALLCYCTFLVMQPLSTQSGLTLRDIKNILKRKNLVVGRDEAVIIQKKAAAAFAASPKKQRNFVDSLTIELPLVIEEITNSTSHITKGKGLGAAFYAPFFHDLITSGNAETFVKCISVMADREGYTRYEAENAEKISKYRQWLSEDASKHPIEP